MSLFGSKKNKETKAEAPTPKASSNSKKVTKAPKMSVVPAAKAAPRGTIASVAPGTVTMTHGAGAILRPRITEKSGLLSHSGVYTFEVAADSNKGSIKRAITALYNVIPTKVAIVNLPSRKVFVRGRRGVVPGVRKAMVTLKKGDKIDFI